MGQSIRATLSFILIFGFFAACFFWATQPMRGHYGIWSGRIITTAIVVGCAAALIYSKTLKDKAPDLLAQVDPAYFERDGLCFAMTAEIQKKTPIISIYYQNRYEKPCTSSIWIAPTKVAFKDVSELPEIKLEVACEGGEFGKVFCECFLPVKFKKEAILWNVAANTNYPDGRGKLLRIRDGLRVGKEAKISGFREFLRLVGAIGLIGFEKPARLKLAFPEQMFSSEPLMCMWKKETLWVPTSSG